MKRLSGIGPMTTSAYVAALDEASRFAGAAQVTSYLRLVPREHSSGKQQRRGRVVRSGAVATDILHLPARVVVCGSPILRPRENHTQTCASASERRRFVPPMRGDNYFCRQE